MGHLKRIAQAQASLGLYNDTPTENRAEILTAACALTEYAGAEVKIGESLLLAMISCINGDATENEGETVSLFIENLYLPRRKIAVGR